MGFLIKIFCFLMIIFTYIATDNSDVVKNNDILQIEKELSQDYVEKYEGEDPPNVETETFDNRQNKSELSQDYFEFNDDTQEPLNVKPVTFVKFTFDAMPLGHSGLLITWKPNITTQSEKTKIEYLYLFGFENCIIAEKNNENHNNNDNQNHCSAVETSTELSYNESYVYSDAGQHKIHSLNKNTLYKISIKQYPDYPGRDAQTILKKYFVERRTNPKSERIPAKPHFEIVKTDRDNHDKRIRWYPCGKNRICNDQESGTHFGITIKELYNRRKSSEVKREEFFKDFIDILFWPGIFYEVVVYSINGNCKTDSDSQDIFNQPKFAPVQYVNVISLPDLSALISWKPPKHLAEKSLDAYLFDYCNVSESDRDPLDRILFAEEMKSMINREKMIRFPIEQKRIFNLKPEVMYTYVVIPVSNNHGFGFQYRNKVKLQVCDQDLPIATPDFNSIFVREYSGKCQVLFQWLPCGQSFNCENTKPGSNFTFHIKPKPLDEGYAHDYGYYGGSFAAVVIYNVTVKSSIGNNFSEAVTKTFKNCSEI